MTNYYRIKATWTTDQLIQTIEDLVWQFAYHTEQDGRPVLTTGGLSALEGAFEVLGWDDPHVIKIGQAEGDS